MERLRFGVIGFGYLGGVYAAAIERNPAARLVGVAVPSQERQAAARSAYPEAQVHGDYRELLDRDDLDAVVVAVPNSLHFAIGTNVLRSGKHLILEKPIALDLADCDRLLALARAQRKLVAIGHQWRVAPLWKAVRHLIGDGAIGRPLGGQFELARAPYRLGSGGWRFDPERVGSWILEETLHLFDLARWYLGDRGEPVSVYARGNTRDPDHPRLQDNLACVVNFPDQQYAVISQTLASFGHHVSVKITGTRGMLWATWDRSDARDSRGDVSLRYGHGSDVQAWPVEQLATDESDFQAHVAAIVHCLQHGGPPPCSGEDGRWSTLLGLAARESSQASREVRLSEFISRPDTLEA